MAELFDSAGRTRFTHFCAVFNCILLQTGNSAISGRFMRPAVPDKRVKFRYPHSKRSREIRLEAIRGGILDKFQLNAVNGVMSDVIVDYTSADAHVKLGDRR